MAEPMETQIRVLLEELKTLRDELRVRIHLAGLEARDRWKQLEPRLSQPEKLVQDMSEAGRERLVELRDLMRNLLDRIRDEEHDGDQPSA